MNIKYILDSDILIYFLKGEDKIVKKVLSLPEENLYITIINYTELLYGIYNSKKVKENLNKILPFLENFKILYFDKKSAKIFAKQKAKLKTESVKSGLKNLWIL